MSSILFTNAADGERLNRATTGRRELFLDPVADVLKIRDLDTGAVTVLEPALPLAGGTMTGDLVMAPNSMIRFTDTVWDDIRIVPSAFDFAGNADPANVSVTFGGRAWRLYEFADQDECFVTVQMPHGYKRGSVLRPHVHWTPGARGNEEAGKSVGWKVDIACAKLNAAFANLATVDLTSTLTAEAVDGQHVIGPAANFTPPADFGESGMLLVRLYRDGGTWAGTATGSLPLLLELDIHFEMDKIGSDAEIPT